MLITFAFFSGEISAEELVIGATALASQWVAEKQNWEIDFCAQVQRFVRLFSFNMLNLTSDVFVTFLHEPRCADVCALPIHLRKRYSVF